MQTWKPVFERATTHDAKALGRTIRIATSPTSTKKELQQALRVYDAFPSHASPPPYAGHFYGAVQTLLDGRLATRKKSA